MKALWDSETNLGRSFFKQFAMVLDMILCRTLQRLMDRKSLAISGDLTLGMRDMKV